ncbi:hypothetical protein LY474_19425 [Myxococcus stipitatus]|nr:hypothetical protein [Myxococcus stipitatus]MCE9669974.1 hypothetical protein [Myxococcus stipitatus]
MYAITDSVRGWRQSVPHPPFEQKRFRQLGAGPHPADVDLEGRTGMG